VAKYLSTRQQLPCCSSYTTIPFKNMQRMVHITYKLNLIGDFYVEFA